MAMATALPHPSEVDNTLGFNNPWNNTPNQLTFSVPPNQRPSNGGSSQHNPQDETPVSNPPYRQSNGDGDSGFVDESSKERGNGSNSLSPEAPIFQPTPRAYPMATTNQDANATTSNPGTLASNIEAMVENQETGTPFENPVVKLCRVPYKYFDGELHLYIHCSYRPTKPLIVAFTGFKAVLERDIMRAVGETRPSPTDVKLSGVPVTAQLWTDLMDRLPSFYARYFERVWYSRFPRPVDDNEPATSNELVVSNEPTADNELIYNDAE